MQTRHGTLILLRISGSEHHITCLAHPDRRPLLLTSKQWAVAVQCPACTIDGIGRSGNVNDMTGRTFGGWVAINSVGISSGAATVLKNQKTWRGVVKLVYRYNRNIRWRCYCTHCHKEREIRGDVLRSGRTPKCQCQTRG